jgi:hypothetical protein
MDVPVKPKVALTGRPAEIIGGYPDETRLEEKKRTSRASDPGDGAAAPERERVERT